MVSQKEGVENFVRSRFFFLSNVHVRSFQFFSFINLLICFIHCDLEIQHTFYVKENDWGFSHFTSWNDVIDPEKGYIKDDTIILQVSVFCI